MNLWRVAVDQSSGRVHGRPRAGHRGRSSVGRAPPAVEGRLQAGVQVARGVGQPGGDSVRSGERCARANRSLLDTQNNIRIPSGISPDGKQLAYYSIGEQQEDLFIGPWTDPCGASRTTPAATGCRCSLPTGVRWSSTRTGTAVGPSGRSAWTEAACEKWWGRRQVPCMSICRRKATGLRSPMMPTTDVHGAGRAGVGSRAHEAARHIVGAGQSFAATAWSRDGSRLAGIVGTGGGRPAGVGMYDFGDAHDDDAVLGPGVSRGVAGRQPAHRLLREGRVRAGRAGHRHAVAHADTRPAARARRARSRSRSVPTTGRSTTARCAPRRTSGSSSGNSRLGQATASRRGGAISFTSTRPATNPPMWAM